MKSVSRSDKGHLSPGVKQGFSGSCHFYPLIQSLLPLEYLRGRSVDGLSDVTFEITWIESVTATVVAAAMTTITVTTIRVASITASTVSSAPPLVTSTLYTGAAMGLGLGTVVVTGRDRVATASTGRAGTMTSAMTSDSTPWASETGRGSGDSGSPDEGVGHDSLLPCVGSCGYVSDAVLMWILTDDVEDQLEEGLPGLGLSLDFDHGSWDKGDGHLEELMGAHGLYIQCGID